MLFTFKGTICGYICRECPEALSNVTLRLYRHREDQDVTALAVANPKDTIAILSDEMVAGKASALIAETVTDESGAFAFELDDGAGYDGGAFEIDVYLETVPGRKSKVEVEPLQFTVTTLQPQWRQEDEGQLAAWDYCLPYRFWCAVRARFDAWVICGEVIGCESEQPLAGLKVSAFDADWIQDDALGSAVTDGSGKFRIDYAKSDFLKTPFPFINYEQVGGPDLFFKIETAGGILLLEEPRSRGRDPDRENAGHCFCVDLCVEIEEEPPYENPWFTHVGDFHILTDISATTGLTNSAVAGHGGPNFGFFGNPKLRGFCPKTLPGDPTAPMRYRFLYEDSNNPGTEVPITGTALVAPVVAGARLILWDLDGSGPDWTFQTIMVAGSGATPDPTPIPAVPPGSPWGPVPTHVIEPDSNGWIVVDPDALDGGFYGPLVRFRSAGAVPVGSAPGNGAGNAVSDPKNGTMLKLIFEAEAVSGGPPTYRDELPRIYFNNWGEVRQLDLQQFQVTGNSCTPLSNDLDIRFTADHELMRSWGLSITTAAVVPGGIPALSGGSAPRGGFGTDHVDISTWPSCSYTVRLSTQRSLTDGENDDDANSVPVTFCK